MEQFGIIYHLMSHCLSGRDWKFTVIFNIVEKSDVIPKVCFWHFVLLNNGRPRGHPNLLHTNLPTFWNERQKRVLVFVSLFILHAQTAGNFDEYCHTHSFFFLPGLI